MTSDSYRYSLEFEGVYHPSLSHLDTFGRSGEIMNTPPVCSKDLQIPDHGLERDRVRYTASHGSVQYATNNCKATEAHNVCCDELAGTKIGHLFHKEHVS